MKITNYFKRPEYIYRPLQIYRKLVRSISYKKVESLSVNLPWNIPIKIHPTELIGYSIYMMGIYELAITEVLWRLTDAEEVAVDVGANIGYMTSIMAEKVTPKGRVLSFEPHPEIYKELQENINVWQKTRGWQQIEYYQVALSCEAGKGLLTETSETNRGTASLTDTQAENAFPKYTVTLARLDEFIKQKDIKEIGVLKIDVEGQEVKVLQGADELIANHQIRDIIFEDCSLYYKPINKIRDDYKFLEGYGYSIFRIEKGFCKPFLKEPWQPFSLSGNWEPINFLATKDPERAIKRLNKNGWHSLNNSE